MHVSIKGEKKYLCGYGNTILHLSDRPDPNCLFKLYTEVTARDDSFQFKFHSGNIVEKGYLVAEEEGGSTCYVTVDSDLMLTCTPEKPENEKFIIKFYENYSENYYYVSVGYKKKKSRILYLDTTNPSWTKKLKMREEECLLTLRYENDSEFLFLPTGGYFIIKRQNYFQHDPQITNTMATRFKFIKNGYTDSMIGSIAVYLNIFLALDFRHFFALLLCKPYFPPFSLSRNVKNGGWCN